MTVDAPSDALRLVIPKLFDGLVKRVADQVAFASQVDKFRPGIVFGTLDGDGVRLMVSFVPGQERVRTPMLIATILP